MSDSMEKALAAQNISIFYHRTPVLEDVNLKVLPGKLTAVLGLNGAGKTTLLRCMAGLLAPFAGRVTLDGKDLNSCSLKLRGRHISYASQAFTADLSYPVREYVVMGVTPRLNLLEAPSAAHYAKADGILLSLGMEHLAVKPYNEVSMGEKQLAFLARTLLQGALYMLVDEPTAFLDFRRQHEFLSRLRTFQPASGTAVLITLHDPNLALNYADTVVFLHNRTVLASIDRKDPDFLVKFEQAAKTVYSDKLTVVRTDSTSTVVWI